MFNWVRCMVPWNPDLYPKNLGLPKKSWFTQKILIYPKNLDLPKKSWFTQKILIYPKNLDFIPKKSWFTQKILTYPKNPDLPKKSWFTQKILTYPKNLDLPKKSWFTQKAISAYDLIVRKVVIAQISKNKSQPLLTAKTSFNTCIFYSYSMILLFLFLTCFNLSL